MSGETTLTTGGEVAGVAMVFGAVAMLTIVAFTHELYGLAVFLAFVTGVSLVLMVTMASDCTSQLPKLPAPEAADTVRPV